MKYIHHRYGSLLGTYWWLHLWRHASQALGSSLHLGLAGSLFGVVGALLSLLELLLSLAELGQVEGGDLLSLLNLALVGLDLLLELVNKVLHALVVLLVLIGLEGELLDAAFALPQVLLSIGVAASLVVKKALELAYAALKLGNLLLAGLQGVALSLLKADLEFLDLDLKTLAHLLLGLSVLLLGAELISKTSSVNHGLLGLLLGVLGLIEHLIEVSLRGKDNKT